MKKLKYLIATAALAACLIGSASAVTPTLKPPKLPDLSGVKIDVSVPKITFPDGYFDDLISGISAKADLSKVGEDDVAFGVGRWDFYSKLATNLRLTCD